MKINKKSNIANWFFDPSDATGLGGYLFYGEDDFDIECILFGNKKIKRA